MKPMRCGEMGKRLASIRTFHLSSKHGVSLCSWLPDETDAKKILTASP